MKEPYAELMDAVAELHRRYPNWRLGQLIANVAGWADQEIWGIEDEQMLAAAQAHLQQFGAGEEGHRSVQIVAIGQKVRNRLIVGGVEMEL